MSRKQQVQAIILGSNPTALGVLRCLGRVRIPTIHVGLKIGLLSFSRWNQRDFPSLLPGPSQPGNLAAALEKLPIDKGVLFPCSDSLAMAVAISKEQLRDRFFSSSATSEVLRRLSDKSELADILDLCDIPHPKTVIVGHEHDNQELELQKMAGAFLKPVNSEGFVPRFGVKAFQVNSDEDMISKVAEIHEAGYEVLLQEYVPGPACNHYFIDGFVNRFGKICCLFARRRLRMYPPDFGNSSSMTSIAIEDVAGAVDSLGVLFEKVRYRGIFSSEFKYDERDDLFKLIEINVRPWLFVEFAAHCGVNVCKMAYDDALERDVSPIGDYKIGVKCVYAYYDIASGWSLFKARQLTAWAWLKSWWGAKFTFFCWDDPMPAIYNSFKWLGGFLKRRLPVNSLQRRNPHQLIS